MKKAATVAAVATLVAALTACSGNEERSEIAMFWASITVASQNSICASYAYNGSYETAEVLMSTYNVGDMQNWETAFSAFC